MLSLVFVLIVTLLAACSSGSASPTVTPASGAASPVEAIKNFFVAVYTGQDPSPFVCSTSGVADDFEIAARVSAATMQGATVDTSGLTFTVKNQTADKATVSVAGQLVYNLISNKSSVDFPASDINAVKEGGFWKFCGAS